MPYYQLLKLSPAHRGVYIGSIAVFLSFLGATLTFPFLQSQRDKFGCDALCYGSMQSLRSGLSMIGTVLIGRLSDQLGRAIVLWIGVAASIVSYLINLHGQSLTAIWLAIIPAALLNQNFSVLKALFADYSSEYEFSEAERASAVGKLGMVIGIAFMLGPVIGANCFSSYEQATLAAIAMCITSAIGFYFLPVPRNSKKDEEKILDSDSQKKGIRATSSISSNVRYLIEKVVGFIYLPALQTPGTRLLLFMRFGMALAFNIFMTVWTVSLKNRFDFGPKGHAYFMGWIGLWYALSQGFIARELVRLSDNVTNLILMCMVTLSLGRVAAMLTSSLVVVYALMAAVVIALGLMNTIMASACSHLAGRDQVGGLYGVMESVESVTGLFGPTLGGLLFRLNPSLPICGVVALYAVIFTAVYIFYDKHISNTVAPTATEATTDNETISNDDKEDDDVTTTATTSSARYEGAYFSNSVSDEDDTISTDTRNSDPCSIDSTHSNTATAPSLIARKTPGSPDTVSECLSSQDLQSSCKHGTTIGRDGMNAKYSVTHRNESVHRNKKKKKVI